MGEAALRWPPHVAEAWTEADLDAMPDDGNKHEVIDGRLIVTPPPRETHQGVADAVAAALRAAAPPGWRVRREIGVRLPSGNVIPDVTVLAPEAPRGEVWTDSCYVALVVEVTSDSTASYDEGDKAAAYGKAGIPSYWRASPNDDAVCIETAVGASRYTRSITVLHGETHLVTDPFEITVDPARWLNPEN
ncbi:MAG: Uma2 family endonuclease [Actinobacteria bacterium]|nr:Uma2 family endonuclease [Actinomycetota bacterium]